jgi:hypothetical protein
LFIELNARKTILETDEPAGFRLVVAAVEALNVARPKRRERK